MIKENAALNTDGRIDQGSIYGSDDAFVNSTFSIRILVTAERNVSTLIIFRNTYLK